MDAKIKMNRKEISLQNESELLSLIQLRGGIISAKNLYLQPHSSAVIRLTIKEQLFRVHLSLRRRHGNRGRPLDIHHLFNSEFYGETFYCLSRTHVVRLFMQACKKPLTPEDQHILSMFLKSHLSYAEAVAVKYNLGIRNFCASQRKRNIQIDGLYFPMKHSFSTPLVKK